VDAAHERGFAYHEVFAGLGHVVLEESWVLAVDASLTQLTMVLDLVLTPEHPDYHPPRDN
jgi:hypothetical protein